MTQAEHSAPERQAQAVAALAEAIRAAGASSGPAAEPADPDAPRTDTPRTDEQRAAALAAAAEVLACGAPADLAGPAVAALGETAAEQLREDPWAVLTLPGVRPEQADGFARGLLGPAAGPGDPRRAAALVPWVLEQAALRGHSAQEIGEVAARPGAPAAAGRRGRPAGGRGGRPGDGLPGGAARPPRQRRGGAADPHPAGPGASGARGGEPRRVPGAAAVHPRPGHRRRSRTRRRTRSHGSRGRHSRDRAAAPGPAAWEAAAAAAPSSSATALLRAVSGSALVVHTGGEASRAELAALLRAADGLGLRAWAAPGRTTAVRSSPGCSTAPRRPGASPPWPSCSVPRSRPRRGRHPRPRPAGRPGRPTARRRAGGDPAGGARRRHPAGAQRRPEPALVGYPGRFLADLTAAKACPVVASRTPDEGPIGELVSGISIGELQPVDAPDKEVVVLAVQDAGEAVHRAVQLLADSIPRALGIPAEQVVLITATTAAVRAPGR
ncbi:helix-hairpin-helix domain-containing protein [Kitasatospora arboriphila]